LDPCTAVRRAHECFSFKPEDRRECFPPPLTPRADRSTSCNAIKVHLKTTGPRSRFSTFSPDGGELARCRVEAGSFLLLVRKRAPPQPTYLGACACSRINSMADRAARRRNRGH